MLIFHHCVVAFLMLHFLLFKWHLNEGDVKGESTLLGGLVFIEFPPTNDTTNLSKGYERFSLGKKIVFQWSKKNQWQK